MSQRFFLATEVGSASTAELVDAEAQHFAKVMRGRVGDTLLAFDGSGYEFTARVAAIRRVSVELEIVSRALVDRESPRHLVLAVALPKGDRQKVMVEKLVELGVAELIPLETERGVAEASTSVLERLRRQVIEASKQCGRNRLMNVPAAVGLAELSKITAHKPNRMVAHPTGEPLGSISHAAPLVVAIGPEGGFTDLEVAGLESVGWRSVSLGPRILRIETAAIAVAAVVVA